MRRAVGAAAAFMLASVLFVAPAGAAITAARVDSPVGGAVLGSNAVGVSGVFTVNDGTRRVGAKFRSRRSTGYAQQVAQDVTSQDGGFGMTSPPLAWNGTYDLEVEFLNIDPDRGVLDDGCTCRTFDNRSIDLLVPPAVPSDVSAVFDAESRSIRVTWKPNGEPDLKGYEVNRKIGNGAPHYVHEVHLPEPPEFVDSNLPEGAAQITYFVTAFRKGVRDTDAVASNGAGQSAAVPIPKAPPTTTTTGPGGATTTKPSTTPTTRRGFGTPVTAPPATTTTRPGSATASRSGGPSTGAFASGLNGPGDRPMTTIDDGYDENLPFQRRDDYNAEEELELIEEDGDGDGDPASVARPDDERDQTDALSFVGAALNVGAWASLGLWLRAQVRRPEDEDEPTLAAVEPGAAAEPEPEPEPLESPKPKPPIRLRARQV